MRIAVFWVAKWYLFSPYTPKIQLTRGHPPTMTTAVWASPTTLVAPDSTRSAPSRTLGRVAHHMTRIYTQARDPKHQIWPNLLKNISPSPTKIFQKNDGIKKWISQTLFTNHFLGAQKLGRSWFFVRRTMKSWVSRTIGSGPTCITTVDRGLAAWMGIWCHMHL